MKKIVISLLIILFPFFMYAQDEVPEEYRVSLSVQLGTDVGGAIPFPFSNIPSPFNAYPQLRPSLGVKASLPLDKGWGVGLEITCKQIAMKADARVESQKFNMKMDDGTVTHMYFTGSAKMNMVFSLLEIPLYARYEFNDKKNRIIFGPTFSYVFHSKFETLPLKGYMGYEPHSASMADISDVDIDFTPAMDKWDLGCLIGYERNIMDKLDIGVRFSMGFKDIFKPGSDLFDYKMLHMRGAAVLSYSFLKTKPLFSKVK